MDTHFIISLHHNRQHHQQQLDQRCHYMHGVKAIQRTTVSGNQLAVILKEEKYKAVHEEAKKLMEAA